MSIRKAVLIGAMALGLAGAGSTAALADTTPTPTPLQQESQTQAPHFAVNPTVTPTNNIALPPPRFRPERFNVLESLIGGVTANYVEARGPVFFHLGRDIQISDTRDVFQSRFFPRSVNVRHTGIGVPTLDTTHCTATLNDNGRWAFTRGTGLYRNARGFGTFVLRALFHFPGATCALVGLTPAQVQADLISGSGLPAPDFYVVAVHGQGSARI
jgi:hypothetical protein